MGSWPGRLEDCTFSKQKEVTAPVWTPEVAGQQGSKAYCRAVQMGAGDCVHPTGNVRDHWNHQGNATVKGCQDEEGKCRPVASGTALWHSPSLALHWPVRGEERGMGSRCPGGPGVTEDEARLQRNGALWQPARGCANVGCQQLADIETRENGVGDRDICMMQRSTALHKPREQHSPTSGPQEGLVSSKGKPTHSLVGNATAQGSGKLPISACMCL
jgi:hypothetical protein